jgi:SAM-dependent methyltransferase
MDLRVETTEGLVAKGEKFDVVSYHHVLEHILDPVRELTNANALLSEGGLLCIVVPGLMNLEQKYFGDLRDYLHIAHPCCFTRETLKFAARKSGFAELASDHHIYAVFEKRNPEQLISSEGSSDWMHYEEVISYLQAIEGQYFSEEGIYRMIDIHKSRVRKAMNR